ncbi:MAG: response regulator transcription factor [Candidatus Omnitrophica bacterium]|nr:response regulator transcription factor [Candidatus Omnitrophota bacterium]
MSAKQKILIVEDEKDISNLVQLHLQKAGFETLTARDGQEAFRKIQSSKPDLIVLDLMLPEMDGKELTKLLKAREDTKEIPIVMLTAKTEEVDRIVGFELGADDYIPKPFSPRELVLRVKVVLKRTGKDPGQTVGAGSPHPGSQGGGTPPLHVGDLVIDESNFEARLKGKKLELTKTEFSLLVELIKAKGRLQTREALLEKVWGFDSYGDSRTVDTHFSRLRQKLGKLGERIETVRGVGYRFQ